LRDAGIASSIDDNTGPNTGLRHRRRNGEMMVQTSLVVLITLLAFPSATQTVTCTLLAAGGERCKTAPNPGGLVLWEENRFKPLPDGRLAMRRNVPFFRPVADKAKQAW